MSESTISSVLARAKFDKREPSASKDTKTHLYKSAYAASFIVGVVGVLAEGITIGEGAGGNVRGVGLIVKASDKVEERDGTEEDDGVG